MNVVFALNESSAQGCVTSAKHAWFQSKSPLRCTPIFNVCQISSIFAFYFMMKAEQNISLKPYNTFGIDESADYLLPINNEQELDALLANNELNKLPLLILGGGSNILFTQSWKGLVLLNRIMGIEVLSEDEETVTVRVGSGENWHQFVMYCLEKGWGGLENLALIPGTVGAAPMQNIGAYGVEVKETVLQVEYVELAKRLFQTIDNTSCKFGYRESIFKHELKNKVFITRVVFTLTKKHKLNTAYGAINEQLKLHHIQNPGISDIAQAVIAIRRSKLPDPKDLGNAGSFFKNPEVDVLDYQRLIAAFPEMPAYLLPDGRYKIPAAWLIEKAGWKGKRLGNTGCHEKQALVIVNYGDAKGAEILQHSQTVMHDIMNRFGVKINPEVNVI
jgi:UDP-N-acetylmuramate dehydrogenase